jgi:flavin reductase (DIM6/NTAB) family NADH-FMN oxidoreductase RutF
MNDTFKTIKPEDIKDNAFQLIGSDWMLITAGPPDAYNTMTASWGGLGVLWSKPIAVCFIRPQRYTRQFIDKAESFTLTFFDEKYRAALELCGTKSGRDIDKAAATGLTPIAGKLPGTTCFAEARLVIECRKIYFQDLDPQHFLDPTIEGNYSNQDYHRMYIGEVVHCLAKV